MISEFGERGPADSVELMGLSGSHYWHARNAIRRK